MSETVVFELQGGMPDAKDPETIPHAVVTREFFSDGAYGPLLEYEAELSLQEIIALAKEAGDCVVIRSWAGHNTLRVVHRGYGLEY